MILNGSSNYYGIILFNFACLLEKKNPGQTEKQENKEVNFACKIIGFYFLFSLLID